MSNIIEFQGISKRFDEVQALRDVTFGVPKGGVHALVGENGAGKSTLIRICGGVMPPDSGTILFEGKPVQFRSAQESRAANISIVHQEIPICPHLTAAENIFLGRPLPRKFGLVNPREINNQVRALFERLQVDIDPTALAGKLPISHQQMIEIAQALALETKLLIMDEPTSALGKRETDRLFEIIRQLVADGITIIYVSHRLEEVFELADSVIVLRDGQYIKSLPIDQTTPDQVVELMVGREIDELFPKEVHVNPAQTLMSVRNLTVPGLFENVSFDLHRGEILGLVGLQGSGNSEVLGALYGRYPNVQGEVLLNGKPVRLKSPLESIKHGIAYVPADRQAEGLFRPMTVGENSSLLILDQIARLFGWVAPKKLRARSQALVTQLGVRTASVDAPVTSLSGGNQQKVVVARNLSTEPIVILMDDPTRGVDVGAKSEIHHILNQITAQGHAIIMVSSELSEKLAMSDRVIVMYRGTVRGELSRDEAQRELVMGLATGTIPSLAEARRASAMAVIETATVSADEGNA
ncbi:MAG: sugar ABC transporter ATP-binding protein [Aggregatilineales bacterium]